MRAERLDGRPDKGTIRIVRPPGLDALELQVGTARHHPRPRGDGVLRRVGVPVPPRAV